MTALSGLKIADFSRILAGPYATMLLGDMGASVIKIERPVAGDDTRTWGPPFTANHRATYFESVNRNKLGVTAELSSESGRLKALEIIAECDVLVENFAVGTMEKFGLGYDDLKAKFPRLIYLSISGFGSSDEAKKLPGYDLLVQGASGLMSVTGPDRDHPSKVGVALVDVVAGLHAALGITTALIYRNSTGVGQKVEINLLSSALSALVNQTGAFTGAGIVPAAMGNAHPSIAPYESFQGKDSHFILAVGNDGQFKKLSALLGVNLAEDPRFHTNTLRVKNRKALNESLSRILATRNSAEWITELTKVGVPAGPINKIDQALELASKLGLNPIVEIIDSGDGSISRTIANPITFSATPVQYLLAPPVLGAND